MCRSWKARSALVRSVISDRDIFSEAAGIVFKQSQKNPSLIGWPATVSARRFQLSACATHSTGMVEFSVRVHSGAQT